MKSTFSYLRKIVGDHLPYQLVIQSVASYCESGIGGMYRYWQTNCRKTFALTGILMEISQADACRKKEVVGEEKGKMVAEFF